MNPLTLLLPILLGVALLVGAMTGHLTPEQLAAGAALLLVPGADRFGPLLRQLLRPGAPEVVETVDDDEALEHAFWAYDAQHKRSGEERLLWKQYMRAALHGQIGVAPTPASAARSTPPSLPPAALALLVVPFLLLAQGCGALGAALKDCAVSSIPATVTEGVGVALRKGDGWEQALADVVKQFGLCMVKTEVGAVAARTPPIAIASLEAASEGTVREQEVAERARAWLRSHQ